jgi:NAD(P)-dependent dehydrogenase (short-subunit alcohol dehydrogenase family)
MLDNRVAIVTGGARGLGRIFALGLAHEGAKVVIADIIDGSPVANEIAESGGQALAISTDVSAEGSTQSMAQQTLEAFGRIDVLINNAARYVDLKRSPWHEVSVEEWDRTMAVNVRGPFLCSRAVFPSMRERGYGKIINIASDTVFKGAAGITHYITSKAGVIGFTRALAREVGEYGIRVNAVAPAYIPHERDYQQRPEYDARIVVTRCIQQTETPEDVLGTIVFLASAASDFITGQTIPVNGGTTFI